MTTVRIATRDSALALVQAREVGHGIASALGLATEIVPLKTTGDRLRGSLAKVGGKGLFVKEIEEALLDGRADVAVHSAKDLPAELHPDLALAAFPERADARDALVTRSDLAARDLDALPEGARVGTGSLRRGAQLLQRRGDLDVRPLRGNVQTRLRKLEESLDAVVLACAGLDRLELADRIAWRIDPEVLLPAVGQGALAVQARAGGGLARDLEALDHAQTAACVAAERAFLAGLGGDCSVPIAGLATLDGDTLVVRGAVFAPDGSRVASAQARVPVADAARGGAEVAREARARGADEILAGLREEATP